MTVAREVTTAVVVSAGRTETTVDVIAGLKDVKVVVVSGDTVVVSMIVPCTSLLALL